MRAWHAHQLASPCTAAQHGKPSIHTQAKQFKGCKELVGAPRGTDQRTLEPKEQKKQGGLGPRVVCDDARHYSQEFRAWSGVWSGGDTTVANALAHYRRSKVSHWRCCLRGVLETGPSSDQNSPIAAPACVPRAAGALTGACRGGIGKPLLLSLLVRASY